MKKRWLRPVWLFIPALLRGASYAHAVTSKQLGIDAVKVIAA